MNFNFKINGSTYIYTVPFSVSELVGYLGFNQRVIVVDYNGFILEKDLWSKTIIRNQDSLEILSIAGGG